MFESVGVGSMGGAGDFVSRALQGIGGGTRQSQNTSVSNSNVVSFNPTMVNSQGGNPAVSPYSGPVSASPVATGTATSAGADPASAFNRGGMVYRTTPSGQPLYDPLNSMGGGVGGESDVLLPLLLGAGLLFLVMNEGG